MQDKSQGLKTYNIVKRKNNLMVCTKISALGDEERSGDGGGIWEKRGGTVNAEDEVDAAGVT